MRAALARASSAVFGGMSEWVAARAARWARRRLGEDLLPVQFGTRRVGILPTRAGLAFATLLFVMLIAGLNYANSIALMLTFLLAGFALIAMHLCHRNLVGTRLVGIGTSNAFAGEHGRVVLTFENSADHARLAITADARDVPAVSVDMAATATARADLPVALEKRGRLPLVRLRVSTTFPFGLFRAWTWVHVPVELLAWPVPRGRREPPQEAATGGVATVVHRAGDEEWASLREFRTGDSPRQVAWGAYARGRGLLVKTYESPAAHHRFFDFDALPGDPEERLEQLAAWIVGADARGERYGVKLAPHELAPDAGREHRTRCLDGLALHGIARPPW
jgi:uncharacterized protein (DUF58 family)